MTAPAPAKPKINLKNKKVLIVGGVVGGVVVFVAYRRAAARNASTAAATQDAGMDAYGQTGGDYGEAGFENAGGSPYGALAGLTFNPATGKFEDPNALPDDADYETITVTDNQSWVKKGLRYLTSLGFDSGPAAQALGKYVSGMELSQQDETLISTVKGGIGSEPTMVPPSTTAVESWADNARRTLFTAPNVKYVSDTANGAIYQVRENGDMIWLNPAEYAALGRPQPTEFYSGNPNTNPNADTSPDNDR